VNNSLSYVIDNQKTVVGFDRTSFIIHQELVSMVEKSIKNAHLSTTLLVERRENAISTRDMRNPKLFSKKSNSHIILDKML